MGYWLIKEHGYTYISFYEILGRLPLGGDGLKRAYASLAILEALWGHGPLGYTQLKRLVDEALEKLAKNNGTKNNGGLSGKFFSTILKELEGQRLIRRNVVREAGRGNKRTYYSITGLGARILLSFMTAARLAPRIHMIRDDEVFDYIKSLIYSFHYTRRIYSAKKIAEMTLENVASRQRVLEMIHNCANVSEDGGELRNCIEKIFLVKKDGEKIVLDREKIEDAGKIIETTTRFLKRLKRRIDGLVIHIDSSMGDRVAVEQIRFFEYNPFIEAAALFPSIKTDTLQLQEEVMLYIHGSLRGVALFTGLINAFSKRSDIAHHMAEIAADGVDCCPEAAYELFLPEHVLRAIVEPRILLLIIDEKKGSSINLEKLSLSLNNAIIVSSDTPIEVKASPRTSIILATRVPRKIPEAQRPLVKITLDEKCCWEWREMGVSVEIVVVDRRRLERLEDYLPRLLLSGTILLPSAPINVSIEAWRNGSRSIQKRYTAWPKICRRETLLSLPELLGAYDWQYRERLEDALSSLLNTLEEKGEGTERLLLNNPGETCIVPRRPNEPVETLYISQEKKPREVEGGGYSIVVDAKKPKPPWRELAYLIGPNGTVVDRKDYDIVFDRISLHIVVPPSINQEEKRP